MTSEELDRAEDAALNMAAKAAYEVTEKVNPDVQEKVFHAMKTYIETGIRLMRAEVEKINESN